MSIAKEITALIILSISNILFTIMKTSMFFYPPVRIPRFDGLGNIDDNLG
jgi:hypothetical protein